MSKQGKMDRRRKFVPDPADGGRAKILWDESYFKQFEDLCYIQCTQAEICNVLDVDPDTLANKLQEHYGMGYSEAYKKFSDGGKMSLRRMQFRKAQEGSNTMLIWLGKQYLGQSEKIVNVDIDKQEAEAMELLKNIENMTKGAFDDDNKVE